MKKVKSSELSDKGCLDLLMALFPEKELKPKVVKSLKAGIKEVA